jgi:dimethylamine monooxygenase subunit A
MISIDMINRIPETTNVGAVASSSIFVLLTSYSIYRLFGQQQRQQQHKIQTELRNKTTHDNDSRCSSYLYELLVRYNNEVSSILSQSVQSILLLTTIKTTDAAAAKQNQKQLQVVAMKKKQKKEKICPFSSESNFIITVKDNAPIPPMELYDDWDDLLTSNNKLINSMSTSCISDDSTQNNTQQQNVPLSARWLNAGMAGQDTPGLLRVGLRLLPDSKYFLLEEQSRIYDELLLKAKAYNNPIRYPSVYVYEEESIAALEECLELFISYLPKRYPDLYQYDSINNSLYVVPLKETFMISDWMGCKALELCGRIVQEDLVLMRPSSRSSDSAQHVMAAAAVVFSFNNLQEKLGQPMTFIHIPVPGYEKDLRRTIDITFNKLLKDDSIMWRNNWGIDPYGVLDEPLYGSPETQDTRTIKHIPTIDEIRTERYIKVEYQTIRRLPQSRYILFTVKSMVDPLSSLESVPNAAKSLANSIRCMSSNVLNYKGIPNNDTRDVILSYLDSIQ